MKSKKCSKCGKPFTCGADESSCWCSNYPLTQETLEQLHLEFSDCLCEDCLATYAASNPDANK